MARTIYAAAATLDGFIADDDGDVEWLTGFEPHPLDFVDKFPVDGFLEGIGSLMMGSTTYESILDIDWPYGDRPSWVMTSRDLPEADGADIRFRDGSVAGVHPEIAASAGDKDVWLNGGGGIASDLLEAGLIDQVQLTLVPIFLGAGKRLFEPPGRPGDEADRNPRTRRRPGSISSTNPRSRSWGEWPRPSTSPPPRSTASSPTMTTASTG